MAQQRSVAELLRAIRTEKGESLRAAARGIGVNPGYLSRVENGEKAPSLELQTRVAAYYSLDEDLVLLASGRVPKDIVTILRAHPELLEDLRTRYGQRPSR